MITKEQVLLKIQQAWDGTPVADVCRVILDQLAGQRGSQIRVINVSTLNMWTKNSYSYDTLLDAAMFLSGRSPHLLDIQYLFHYDDELEIPITREEIKKAKKDGFIPHPDSGEEIVNYEEYISFYFRPSNDARQLTH